MVFDRRSELVEYGSPEDTGKLIGEEERPKVQDQQQEVDERC